MNIIILRLKDIIYKIIISRKINLSTLYIHFLNKIIWPLFHRELRRELRKTKAVKVMEENWDYLIILDACRHDTFKKLIDEDAKYVISGGTHTKEWMKWNFGNNYKDVIYIAGNPHLASYNLKKVFGFNPFYLVKEVWDYGWSIILKTVPPEEVTIAALDTIKIFPEKRMIIHYNQPHHPFINDKEISEKDNGTWHPSRARERRSWGEKKKTVWDLAKKGDISIERVIKSYEENLKIVWKEVKKLKEELSGKIILTSDHGNAFGEYGIYGHGGILRLEGLVKVPWVVLKDDKKDIWRARKTIARDKIKERLTRLRKRIK